MWENESRRGEKRESKSRQWDQADQIKSVVHRIYLYKRFYNNFKNDIILRERNLLYLLNVLKYTKKDKKR